MKATGVGDIDTGAALADLFWTVHQGSGHGATDARTAAKARYRISRESR